MLGKVDAKKKALDELMSHLDERDGMELGDAMKPKGVDVEVEKLPGEESEESPDMEAAEGMEGGKPELSEEQIQELIEALQSKLG